MDEALEKLIAIASSALIDSRRPARSARLKAFGSIADVLNDCLTKKNGFYAFESSLHVFPVGSLRGVMDLDQWNSETLWRECYGEMAENCLFFAEDVFGGQFCIRGSKISFFEPETGVLKEVAASLGDWATRILDKYHELTGFPLAHAWQVVNGPLPSDYRLVPKIPFVCGGEYSVDNLRAIDAVKGMRFRGDLAQQIKGLPDGTKINFKILNA